MSKGKEERIFFKGLNELRAIAALAVVFHHIELYKRMGGKASLIGISELSYFTNSIGKHGVYLFFVLSGFLITYLLFIEQERYDKINVKDFYVRRVLRIWPLYYLIVFLSFFIVPLLPDLLPFLKGETNYINRINVISDSFYLKLALFLMFFSHIALATKSAIAGAAQTWSVSVEEQFYIFWPVLLKLFKKNIVYVALIIIFFKPLFLIGFKYALNNYEILNYKILFYFYTYLVEFPVHYMCIGALTAYLFFYYKEVVIRLFSHKLIIIGLYVSTCVLLFYPVLILNKGLPILFGGIILHVITAKKIFEKQKTILNFLGKISYGIYMYHPIIMFLCFGLINSSDIQNIILYNVLVYFSIISLTIGISYLSYTYFEKYFLNFKHKFSKVKSGDS
ncbi:acyltransferase family protein [Bernardetia sp. OM2101]|uniref:acyltransferase family protein n=1 Tax=Bernardetia sp. OM2101 TaxID=3344876 RepID=UPI0035D0788A